MKLRNAFLLLASAALLATGCGSDAGDAGEGGGASKDKSAEAKEKSGDEKEMTRAEKDAASDRENKEEQVKSARAAFKKSGDDVGACRNLAMSYIALASPASSADPKDPPKLPKDREENLDKAVKTLETCSELNGAGRDVQQMLASTYMATNEYDKATPLLEQLARSAEGQERANSYYAWGLAASNAEQYDDAIAAWEQFIELSPDKDPRIAQVRQSITALRAAQRKPAAAAQGAGGEGENADAAGEGGEAEAGESEGDEG